jgi:hypothetical protein
MTRGRDVSLNCESNVREAERVFHKQVSREQMRISVAIRAQEFQLTATVAQEPGTAERRKTAKVDGHTEDPCSHSMINEPAKLLRH